MEALLRAPPHPVSSLYREAISPPLLSLNGPGPHTARHASYPGISESASAGVQSPISARFLPLISLSLFLSFSHYFLFCAICVHRERKRSSGTVRSVCCVLPHALFGVCTRPALQQPALKTLTETTEGLLCCYRVPLTTQQQVSHHRKRVRKKHPGHNDRSQPQAGHSVVAKTEKKKKEKNDPSCHFAARTHRDVPICCRESCSRSRNTYRSKTSRSSSTVHVYAMLSTFSVTCVQPNIQHPRHTGAARFWARTRDGWGRSSATNLKNLWD